MFIKQNENQKANSNISLFGGKIREELLKRYLFSDLHEIAVEKVYNL